MDDSDTPTVLDTVSSAPERSKAIAKQRPKRPNAAYVRVGKTATGGPIYYLKPEGYTAIREASANGRAIASIAREVLNMDPTSFAALRERDPYAQECVEVGRALMSDELHDLLMTSARDGNTIAQIFLARSRAGWSNDAGAIEGLPQPKVVNNTQINITLQEPMTEAELRALIQPPAKVIDDDAD